MSLLLIILSFFLYAKTDCTDYCSTSPRHVLCKEHFNLDAKCPKNTNVFPIKESDKEEILALLNSYRSKVAKGETENPEIDVGILPVANMMQMEWDEELERTAIAISQKCKPYELCEDCINLERFQSFFVQTISFYPLSFKKPLPWDWETYFDVLLTKGQNTKGKLSKSNVLSSDERITPYEQMMWAESYLVGCGITIFNDYDKIGHNFVCTFGPVVPKVTEPSHRSGLPCTLCPSGSVCSNENNLLCHCENICYPFEYKYVREKRADASAAPAKAAVAAAIPAPAKAAAVGGAAKAAAAVAPSPGAPIAGSAATATPVLVTVASTPVASSEMPKTSQKTITGSSKAQISRTATSKAYLPISPVGVGGVGPKSSESTGGAGQPYKSSFTYQIIYIFIVIYTFGQ